MGRRTDRMNRPTKVCATCGREFAWRKKWERCWEQVRHCSDRCRKSRNARNGGST